MLSFSCRLNSVMVTGSPLISATTSDEFALLDKNPIPASKLIHMRSAMVMPDLLIFKLRIMNLKFSYNQC
ncbi:hypothetical protein D3C85_1147130 [compost metagenome]